jgi:uncharacterized protein (TIRG00374 family)
VPWHRIILLLAGLGLLAWILVQQDLAQIGHQILALGLAGAGAVICVFLLAFLADTASWQLMVPGLALTGRNLYRLWRVRMAGEALNLVVPAGTLGGEPVKAILLKTKEGVPYDQGVASLVLAKTVNLLSLLVFAGLGVAAMALDPDLPAAYELAAGLGLAALVAGVIGFFAVQRWAVASRLAVSLAGRRWGRKLASAARAIAALDDHYHRFYVTSPGRFAAAFALALANWVLGLVELHLIMGFLGDPVSWSQALIMEAAAQLIRAGFFFIPASLGATELGMVALAGALTGNPASGLALALVRRARESLWIAWGLWLGWRQSADLTAAAIRGTRD